MAENYTSKYLKIYFWQAISFILNFVSLFIVVPSLSIMPNVYGIYSICVGMTIFLSYADLGFMGAGTKYASESCIKGDITSEKRYIGQAVFIYGLIASFLFLVFLLLAYSPTIIVSDIKKGTEEFQIAQSLLFILALSIPVGIMQKYITMIYNVRLMDYKIQKVNIIGALVRIASVLLFFFNNKYDIVGYYAFTQIVLFTCASYLLWKTKSLSYGFLSIFKNCRFHKPSFDVMKGLAVSGIAASISWILYYELDSLAIGKVLGARSVAYYAIGFTLISFFRSALSIFFSPYNVRFNYFVGNGDLQGLSSFCLMLIKLSATVLLPPFVAVICFANPFVMAWVGPTYQPSVLVMQFLVACYLFSFITNPLSFFQISLKQVKFIYYISVILPTVYWVVIILTFKWGGIYSFAFSKLLAFAIAAIVYVWVSYKSMRVGLLKYIREIIFAPLIQAVIPTILLSYLLSSYVYYGQDDWALFWVIASIMLISVVVWIINLAVNKDFRVNFINVYKTITKA